MILELIKNSTNALAALIDPDKADEQYLEKLIQQDDNFDFYFVGGSLVSDYQFDTVCKFIKSKSNKSVILFPGNGMHISSEADAILFLSLISGRNPEYLIGQQVLAAPRVKQAGIEPIPTGYMLFDGGKMTTANYISNTIPIPKGKADIAATTALAGEMLGLQSLYLDTGSGADETVEIASISKIKSTTNLPLIVGGGVRSKEKVQDLWDAGANIVVVGTALEDQDFIF